MTPQPLLTVDIRYEQDVVSTRQRARQIAGMAGLTGPEQTSFATAVSEIARNAFQYGGGGKVEFALEQTPSRPMLMVRVRDQGKGIPNLQQILQGQHRATSGTGMGILGSQRLTDVFDIRSDPTGTVVTLGKGLPAKLILSAENLSAFSVELAKRAPLSPVEEVQQQNRELLAAMESLHKRQAEVERLNAELAETNRGVLALYAELDDQAVALRNVSELKSRFLSDMSHELRTPLNAMISISGLLLDRADGELTEEQEKQVGLIRKSAESLREMVSDLLDLAKIEAGRSDVHVSRFDVTDVFLALRGMFRPLFTVAGPVALIVEECVDLPLLQTDEQKLSQILRNFISNSLKFTEKGEVRVSCRGNADGTVTFEVSDTGIGIAPDDMNRIFEDYMQVDSKRQRSLRGTGLGLPLSRKLARLLGGEVAVNSEPGLGSTFSVTIPMQYAVEPQHSSPAAESVTHG